MDAEHRNIVVVDDDPSIRNTYKTCLRDFDVHEAASVHEARDIINSDLDPYVCIADLMMPSGSGCDLLGDKPIMTGHVQPIIVTAKNMDGTEESGYIYRRIPVIKKPSPIQVIEAYVWVAYKEAIECRALHTISEDIGHVISNRNFKQEQLKILNLLARRYKHTRS